MNKVHKLLLLFAISFIAQLIFIWLANFPIAKDAMFYDSVAQNLVAGNGFSENGKYPTLNVKPGYTLFLAAVYFIFGHSLIAVKIIQAMCISFSCLVVYMIGKEVFNERIGFISASATALYPPFFSCSSHLITENLFILILSLSIFFYCRAIRKEKIKYYIYAAIFLGLSTQIRQTAVFFPIVLLIGHILVKKDLKYAARLFFINIAIIILFLTPMTVRNFKQFGVFHPLEGVGIIWMGTFFDGNAYQGNAVINNRYHEIVEEAKQNVQNNKKFS